MEMAVGWGSRGMRMGISGIGEWDWDENGGGGGNRPVGNQNRPERRRIRRREGEEGDGRSIMRREHREHTLRFRLRFTLRFRLRFRHATYTPNQCCVGLEPTRFPSECEVGGRGRSIQMPRDRDGCRSMSLSRHLYLSLCWVSSYLM